MNVPLLRTRLVARRLDTSERNLERMRLEGRGPRFVKIGRSVRYSADDVEAWIAAHAKSSTSETKE
jgi:predicted DNA-binding transcriptional regulator AlpA